MSEEKESGNIWPEVDLTDSEDEETTTKLSKRKNILIECAPEVTKEEIEGDFPMFLKNKDDGQSSDSEQSDEEEKEAPKPKFNPYLAHNTTNKFDEKLRNLQMKRNEARKLNHKEVAEEDMRKKLPKNYEAMRRKAEWEVADKQARQEAEEAGEDYERVKMLGETAEDVEITDRRKRKKKNMDPGFSDYAAAQFRQYERLTKQMKADDDEYERNKQKMGDNNFPSAHNLMYGTEDKVSEAGVDRMVNDLEKQIEKRSKFHRRRQHFDEADIDYINESNAKFNKKAERYYGQYTEEIRQNLERGTAI